MRQAFINDKSSQLGAMNLSSEDPEENWTVFQKVVHSSAATTIGHPSRKHQDWFDENDEEIKLLLEEKHCLPIHSGSLKRIDYPKHICLAHPLSFECFHCS